MGHRLFYHPDGYLNAALGESFSDSLFRRLTPPLAELGYCLTQVKGDAPLDSQATDLSLWVVARQSESGLRLVAAVLPEFPRSSGRLNAALRRPLTEFDVPLHDAPSAGFIFAQKVVENLRTQYVAQLAIVTLPDSAHIRSDRGLEGKTPLEWVLPLGQLHVTASLKGYLTRDIHIDLSRPGDHTINLPLVKRRFYHSAFFPWSMGLALTSLGAYWAENHYYTRYHRLGPEEQRNQPEKFGELFRTAQNWETAAGWTLAGALLTLGLSFTF